MENIIIVKIIDSYSVVINKGIEDGIKQEDKFVIFKYLEEITDPTTNKSLGRLKLKKGTATIEDIQDKMSIITSDNYKNVTHKRTPSYQIAMMFTDIEETNERTKMPFERDVEIGDSVEIYNRKKTG